MQQTLHLIRHGEINSNIIGALDTATPGPPLNTTGLDQAKRLVNTFANAPLDTIYASTATRAQMTAEPLAQARGLEINVRDGLKEISAGSLKMSADRAHQKEYLGVITSWMLGELDTKLAGGTTGHEVLERFDSVVTEIKESGAQHTAIVAHGAIIVFWSAMRAPQPHRGYSAELSSAQHGGGQPAPHQPRPATFRDRPVRNGCTPGLDCKVLDGN